MKLKIRPSQSDWDDLKGLFPDNKETGTENNIVMFSLFVIGIGLIVIVFIVGIFF
ncbi:hypothetical protein ACFX5F_02260 [Flavobacterium sp. ZS1P70]|uniref:DUF2970 domain-containing protein n=1 Tax=Flavobacterium zhoui TaxID=3230414 RepID=A0ABW6I188_9FLAO